MRRASVFVPFMLLIAAAVLWPLLILVAAEDNRIVNALLGAICFFAALLFSLVWWTAFRSTAAGKRQVPHAHAAIVMKQQRRLRIVRGPAEVQPPSHDEESIELKDLRDHRSILQHEYVTSDNAKVQLKWEALWYISDLERYLDSAVEPREILEGTLQARMIYHVAKAARKDLAGKLEAIADNVVLESNRHAQRYGIYVVAVNFTLVEIPGDPPKSPKPGEAEAERIRTLDSAIKEANPRTVLHIERLAKTAKDRESGKN